MNAVCASCQASLEPGALEGLCPRCLLVRALPLERAEDVPTTAALPFVPPSLAELAPLFPQLEILQLLGQGGMGAVYKARQIKLDRLVALKILPPATAKGPGFAERFTREARALAKLSHPHIVAVHDFGDVEGLYYLVMEYVEGVNLRQSLAVGRLEPRQALALVGELCSALQYAHEMGVVHRDIKPENVLLDRQGHVKIADFGLAKIVGQGPSQVRLTGTQQAMGTPHYMAPEQWERPLEVDHRADIYSLGVVFYELLTGELPLGKFAPPSEKAGGDVRLDQVVLRAMEKEPAQRYQRMSEMKSAVDAVEQPPIDPIVPVVPMRLPPRLKRELFWSSVVGAAMFLAALWLAQLYMDREKSTIVTAGVILYLAHYLAMAFYFPDRSFLWELPRVALFGLGLTWLFCELTGTPDFLTTSGWFFIPFALFSIWLEGSPFFETILGGIQPVAEESGASANKAVSTPVLGLSVREESLRQLLISYLTVEFINNALCVLPDIESGLLPHFRMRCAIPADERIIGLLVLGRDGQWGVVFGCQGLYWCNGDDMPHVGVGSLPYAELVNRRLVNHGDAVFLGNNQYICSNEYDTGITTESLTTFLSQVRDRITSYGSPSA